MSNSVELFVYHGSEVPWTDFNPDEAPDKIGTYSHPGHIYFSSKENVAATYLKQHVVYKDVPDNLRLFSMYRDYEHQQFFWAECDTLGNPTGKGLEPKTIEENELFPGMVLLEDVKNGQLQDIPFFKPDIVFESNVFKMAKTNQDNTIDIQGFKQYESVSKSGNKLFHSTDNLSDDITYVYQNGEPIKFEPRGVVRGFTVRFNNPLIVDGNGHNAVVPFTDNNGHTWGKVGQYSYERLTPIESIEKYAKDNGYDGVILKNIQDIGSKFSANDNLLADTIVAFKADQIQLGMGGLTMTQNEARIRSYLKDNLGAVDNNGSLDVPLKAIEKDVGQLMKREFYTGYSSRCHTIEDVVNKDNFIDYFESQTFENFNLKTVGRLAHQISEELDINPAETMSYLVEDPNIHIQIDYGASQAYDNFLANETNEPSLIHQRALELHLLNVSDTMPLELKVTHSLENPKLQEYLETHSVENVKTEYLDAYLTSDPEFMQYLHDQYKEKFIDSLSQKINADPDTITRFMVNVYRHDNALYEIPALANERSQVREELQSKATYENRQSFDDKPPDLTKTDEARIKAYLLSLDNVKEENGRLIITSDANQEELIAAMKDEYESYAYTHANDLEQLFSKKGFIYYLKGLDEMEKESNNELGEYDYFQNVAKQSLADQIRENLLINKDVITAYLNKEDAPIVNINKDYEAAFEKGFLTMNPESGLNYFAEKGLSIRNQVVFNNDRVNEYSEAYNGSEISMNEELDFTTNFERAAKLYEVGQHQLSDKGVEKVQEHLATLDNVTVENGKFIITTEPQASIVETWMKEEFDEYLERNFRPEEMLSKEQFLDYMKYQEIGGFRFEKVANLATNISNDLNLNEAEVLTYLADSPNVEIRENYHLEKVYDQTMASVNPVTRLSYVEEKAINMYLYVNKGMEDSEEFELEHDVTNPNLRDIVNKIDFSTQSDEYIEETLSNNDEFMDYIEDWYKNQVTNEVAEALNLDKDAVLGHFLSSYECNDGLQQVEDMIVNEREQKYMHYDYINAFRETRFVGAALTDFYASRSLDENQLYLKAYKLAEERGLDLDNDEERIVEEISREIAGSPGIRPTKDEIKSIKNQIIEYAESSDAFESNEELNQFKKQLNNYTRKHGDEFANMVEEYGLVKWIDVNKVDTKREDT